MNSRNSLKFLVLVTAMMVLASTSASAAGSIPAGATATVRLGQSISSQTAHSGDSFTGSLANDIVVNGTTVAKAGAPVKGTVTFARESGRLHKPGALTIRLTSIDGQSVSTSSISRQGQSHTKSNATKIGGGAAAGALIGALAGGGKGAAIGAGVGAGAGTGVAMATGLKNVVLSAESAYTFTVTSGSTSQAARRRR